MTGGEVTGNYPEYGYAAASVLGSAFNFQTVQDYARPQWPGQEHPQQFHLDLRVSDIAAATEHAVSLGATASMVTVPMAMLGPLYCDQKPHERGE